MKTKRLAAIDIGSNSIKLAVVAAAASDSLTITYREKDVVRLGHETLRARRLSDEAIERAARSIGRLRQIAETRGAETVLTVATASVREAYNAAEFIERVEAATGVRVEVLSPVEEARLIGVAVSSLCGEPSDVLLNIDIGGGSTELSLMKNKEPEQLFSMRLGAVGLTEKFLSSDPPTGKQLRDLQTHVRATLERPASELAGATWNFATGTSGTILAISRAINYAAGVLDVARAETGEIAIKKLTEFNRQNAKMTRAERLKIPTMSSQRAEIIVAGGQILEIVMQTLKINALRGCEYALREGAVIDFLRQQEAESKPPVPDVADRRLRGVFAVGRRFGYQEEHALQLANVAEQLYDQLTPIYGLTRHDRTLLSAAAILHDIGYAIAHDSHHKHTLYLIKHSELTGFSESERHIVANVARYYRGSQPKDKHPDFMELTEENRRRVWRLGGVLRFAHALNHAYGERVQTVRLQRDGKNLLLEVVSDVTDTPELGLALEKADMLEAAFDCRLTIVRYSLAANV